MRLPVDSVRAGEVTELMREHEVTMDSVSYIQVHPTFLYESLWNLSVLAVLIFSYYKREKEVRRRDISAVPSPLWSREVLDRRTENRPASDMGHSYRCFASTCGDSCCRISNTDHSDETCLPEGGEWLREKTGKLFSDSYRHQLRMSVRRLRKGL